jgi:hypothetical protein
MKARNEGRLREALKADKTGQRARLSRGEALRAWGRIADALASSESADDRHLAHEIRGFVQRQPVVQAVLKQRPGEVTPLQQRPGPDIVR